jgi:WD40 repeat protein
MTSPAQQPKARGWPARGMVLFGVCLQMVPVSPAAEPDFYRDVYPFLKANCISCHNKTTTKAGLNIETPETMRKGGESGPAIIPGKSAKSLIVQAAMHSKDLEMPPKNNKSGAVNLTPAEIKTLRSWIDRGAKSSVQQERQVVWQPLASGVRPIYSVAMTRDGRFAVCGRANEIFLHDLATRQFVTLISDDAHNPGAAHRALVQSLAFSPDGTRLASGSFREVKIWRQETGEATTSNPTAGAGNPVPKRDDELIVRADTAGALEVISVANSNVITKIAATNILSLGLSRDGKQLVTGGADGAIRVWDVEGGKQAAEMRGGVTESRQMAALEWTIASQATDQTFQKSEVARIEAQNKAFDELLKKANETIVAVKKTLPEKQKAVKPAEEARAAAQKAVDELVAPTAGSADGKPDADKQRKGAQDKLASTVMAETSALAALAAAENNITDAEADVKRISEARAKNDHDLAAAKASIATSKETQDKASADLAAAKQASGTRKPLAVAISHDAQMVAAIFNDGALIVWAVASALPIEEVIGSATTAASLSPNINGTFLARTADGTTVTTRTRPRWVLERVLGGAKDHSLFADRVNALRFSPDGKTLATGGGEPSRSGDISLFDVANGKLIETWKERHQDAVLSLDFSPDGKLLASGGADKIARVTEVATGRQVNVFEGHTHHVMGVSFRADGRALASAGGDGVVLVWDMIAGERKKKIEGWGKEVTSLQFIGATRQIVTSAGDNRIRIVNDDGAEVRAMSKLPDFMQSAASTATASIVIGGGEESVLRVWDGTNGKELAAFGAR